MNALRKELIGILMMISVAVAVGCSAERQDVPPVELSPEAKARAMERERMEPYENLRTIDGRRYEADAYEAVVGRLAANNCGNSHQKIVDMAAFSKGKLRGVSRYQILMDIEKELRGMRKPDCAETFAAYILLNGGG